MKKFFIGFVVVLAIFASQGQVSAQLGAFGVYGMPYGTWLPCSSWLNWLPWLGGYPWLTVPGCEVQMVAWRNHQMVWDIWDIGRQASSWPYPGWPGPPQSGGVYPVYQPTGQQYIVVRVPKSRGHQWLDIAGTSAVGAAVVGGITRSVGGAAYGALGGFGGGMLYSQHEYDSYVVPLPAPPPPPVQQLPQPPPSQAQPPPPQVPPPEPEPSSAVSILRTPGEERLALSGAPMQIVNDSKLLVLVTADGENVVFLEPGARTPRNFRSPRGNMRFYIVNPNPQTGVMEGLEIEPESDSSLPGFRIPSETKAKT